MNNTPTSDNKYVKQAAVIGLILLFSLSILIVFILLVLQYSDGSNINKSDKSNNNSNLNMNSYCKYDGQKYNIGDIFISTDNCNTCTCLENSTVVCTKNLCTNPSDEQEVVTESNCEYGGEKYSKGSSFLSTDKCNTCTCLDDLTVGCTKKLCTNPSGEQEVVTELLTYSSSQFNYSFKYPVSFGEINDEYFTLDESGKTSCYIETVRFNNTHTHIIVEHGLPTCLTVAGGNVLETYTLESADSQTLIINKLDTGEYYINVSKDFPNFNVYSFKVVSQVKEEIDSLVKSLKLVVQNKFAN